MSTVRMDHSTLHVIYVVMSTLSQLLLFVPICYCRQQTFFVKPTYSSYCPEEAKQCYDLNTLLSEIHLLSAQNTTLLFLPGEHFLDLDLDVRNTEEFWMIPYIQSNDSTAKISVTCTNYGQTFYFQNVLFVKVDSISFHSCGVENSSYGAFQLRSVYDSEITNSKWYESRSSALFIEESNTVLSDCKFVRGSCSNCFGGGIHSETSTVILTGSNDVTENTVWVEHGGGLFLNRSSILLDGNLSVNNNLAIVHANEISNGGGLYLKNCTFTATNASLLLLEMNYARSGGGLYFDTVNASIAGDVVIASNSGGGGSYVASSQCYFTGHTVYYNNSCHNQGGGLFIILSYVAFSNVEFAQNSASTGGAIASTPFSTVELGNATFTNNTAESIGGGIYTEGSKFIATRYIDLLSNTAPYGGGIAFSQSECKIAGSASFSQNKAKISGGSLHVAKTNITFLSSVTISTSTAGWAGGGIFVEDDSLLVMRGKVFIENSNAYFYGGAIVVDHSISRMTRSSEITSNSAQYGGAIHAIASDLHFVGNHFFNRNCAQFGGGLSLSDGSLMYFNYAITETHIRMTSNHANQYGGALWVEDVPFHTCINTEIPSRRCFYQCKGCRWWSDQPNRDLYIFSNNTAELAGSSIYGGNIQNCLSYDDQFFSHYDVDVSKEKFHSIFSFINDSSNSSSISSDPLQVCLCTQYNEPDCSISSYTIEVFSGQQFPLSLVGVGQRNGTVPAVILSYTDSPSDSTSTVKTASSTCSTLIYMINSANPIVKLLLYPDSPCHNFSTHIFTVYVNIKPCPPGFILHNKTKSCICGNTMRKLDIQCDINSQSFAHSHGVWVDYLELSNYTETVIYHPHCPFDYCTQELSNFTFNSTDNQCRYNRSGLICGGCKKGYSLTLGGSKCTQCSHVYILLFFPLAVAGVILVFFLLTLRLTVSMGTINGLIFFANIIGTNSSTFLPPESTVVLRVFIAWLNLDLGIDTCLVDGLDMYSKVWLQFVFPFYVFLLIGIIIIISHRSILFTRFLGSDPVAVLATLILLAYTKFFRAVLTVMSFTYIQASDDSFITVWLYDGNVRYLSGKHIPLFLFALLIFLLLIVPYTVILLFAPCLQPHTHNKFLFWIDDYRLKPFLFSYYAPLKKKYRSWIGFLLVLRLCLMIVFVSNSLGDPRINVFAIAAVVVLLLCLRVFLGTFYTNWILDALELFFMMKLGLFSLSTLYVLNTSRNQKALAHALVGSAFTLFLSITVYHGWRQLINGRFWRLTLQPKFQKYFFTKKEKSLRTDGGDEQHEESPTPPRVATTFIDLRESLLESA